MPGPYRILVVDDEPSVLATYRMLLEDEGYAVSTALTSAEARGKLKQENYNLLMCDLSLDGKESGFDLIELARQGDSPVASILVTGYATQEALVRAQQRGIPVLPKPIEIEELLTTISHMVREHDGNDGAKESEASKRKKTSAN